MTPNKFIALIGRSGHALVQIAMFGAQVYIAYLQGGRISAINAGVALGQLYIADKAYTTIPAGAAQVGIAAAPNASAMSIQPITTATEPTSDVKTEIKN